MKLFHPKKLLIISLLTLVSACSSTPKERVVDEYSTNIFRWNNDESEALNILRSADLQKYYNDVDSVKDLGDVRYRHSTAKKVFDNTLGFAAFGVVGLGDSMLFLNKNKDTDFKGPTFITYIPIDNVELNSQEQVIVREKALEKLAVIMNTGGTASDFQSFKPLINQYRISYSGEACDFVGKAYVGTSMEKRPCLLAVIPEIVRIIQGDSIQTLEGDKTQLYAAVKVQINGYLSAFAIAKNITGVSFMAFPDMAQSYGSVIATSTPVVIAKNRILPFLTPSPTNPKELKNGEAYSVVVLKKTKATYSIPFFGKDGSLIKTKLENNKIAD